MTIFKSPKNHGFTIVHNEFLNVDTLSWGAKGLHAYITSKPENWQIRKTDLVKRSSDGKTKIDGYLLELMAHGYMNWYPIKNDVGQIDEWCYEVYHFPDENPNKEACIKEGLERIAEKKKKTKAKNEKKKPQLDNPTMEEKIENPQLDYPEVDNPAVDNPAVDNPPFSNKDLNKKDSSNTYVNKTNYYSLSIDSINNIDSILTALDFTEKEREQIKLLASEKGLTEISKDEIIFQATSMASKRGIVNRPSWFVNGLYGNVGRNISKEFRKPVEDKPSVLTAKDHERMRDLLGIK